MSTLGVKGRGGGGEAAGGGAGSARVDPDGLIQRLARLDPWAIAALVLLAAPFFLLSFRWFQTQLGPGGFAWAQPEDWGHSYLVPVVGAVYIWMHREGLRRAAAVTFWPGLVVMFLGLGAFALFAVGPTPNHMFQGASLLLLLGGLVLLVSGPKAFGFLAFPIGYLGLGITISTRLMDELTFGLKLLATQGSYVLLQMLGVDVAEPSGNLLSVFPPGSSEPVQLNVAEACSGMRMVIAFIALGAAVAFLSCRQWWQRIAVMLLTVPVALLMNVVRVAVLAVLSLADPEVAEGDAHMLIGTLLLIPAFFLFMGCVWASNRIVVEDRSSGVRSAPSGAGGGS